MSLSITVCSARYSVGSPAPMTLTRPMFPDSPPSFLPPPPLLHATAITAIMAGTTNSFRRRIRRPSLSPSGYLIPAPPRRSIRCWRALVPIDPRSMVRIEEVQPPGVHDELDRIALPRSGPRAETGDEVRLALLGHLFHRRERLLPNVGSQLPDVLRHRPGSLDGEVDQDVGPQGLAKADGRGHSAVGGRVRDEGRILHVLGPDAEDDLLSRVLLQVRARRRDVLRHRQAESPDLHGHGSAGRRQVGLHQVHRRGADEPG